MGKEYKPRETRYGERPELDLERLNRNTEMVIDLGVRCSEIMARNKQRWKK